MAWNIYKPRGASSSNKLGAGGAVVNPVPLFGIVKDNIDPIRAGRLRVYISDMGGTSPNDSNTWFTVNYMTPFYGATEGTGDKTGYGTYLQNPISYGMWNSPPDIGTTVICIFVNGDPNYGYWIGCVPEPETLWMVPANGSTETAVLNEGEANSYGGAKKLPVTNINANNQKINDTPAFFNEPKPVNSYLAGVLNQQGLIRDTIRGTIGSSSQRETPSRVGWGVNTPGRPIYEGGFTDETIADAATGNNPIGGLKITSRRVGHSIVMDDGDLLGRDQLVRIRSSLGHQILMSDDGQCLHIIHANGQSWVELGKEGTIDLYATNSVNIRTQGDLNLHADNNININAKKDLKISADNINIETENKMGIRVGTDFSTYTLGKYTLKTDYQMSFKSSGEASFASQSATYINGSKINLNTGSSGTVPQEVKPLTRVAHTDTLYDATKGWAAAPGALISIVSRAPAHSPWSSANQGVDVKVDNNASANFPSAPSAAVAAANAAVPATPATPVAPSVASTVPVTGEISKALDKNTTTAMVGQVATMAQTGPGAAAVKLGAGVVNGVAVIGKMAQSPQQLEAAGVIKPGSAALVTSLISSGKTIEQSMPPVIFAGLPGAENIVNYINNPTAQVKAQVSNLQQAQTQLTQAGVITGKESSGQIAGLVTATASVGLASTVNYLKTASGALTGGGVSGIVGKAGGAINTMLGSVTGAISSGNFAANLSSVVTGGLGSIATSLSGLTKGIGGGLTGLLDSAKGIAGSAFAAITGGFPTLKAGVPQNLKQIADKAIADVQASGTEASDVAGVLKSAAANSGIDAASIASGAASSATNGLASVTSAVTTGLGASTNLVTSAENAVSAVRATLPASASTGLSGLPGAQSAVSNIIDNAKGAINSIPGASTITGAISQVTSSISTGSLTGAASTLINKLKLPGASLQALASVGLSPALAAKLNSSIASLSSGGAVPITLPDVGVNTNLTRTALSTQLASVFGSNKIQVPNYSGNPATTGETAGTQALTNKADEQRVLTEKVFAKVGEVREARLAFTKAKNELPAGDPQINELRNKWLALSDELAALETVA
jgi:hypothetical protein